MNTKTLKQQVTLKASPLEVYNLLMDSEKHGAFTGGDVTMSKEINGEFSVFDGYCRGYNIELDPGKKIVQAWHFAEDGWPDEHFSICTFELNVMEKGTMVIFTQTGIPEHKYESLKGGWKDFYWEPIKQYLAEQV